MMNLDKDVEQAKTPLFNDKKIKNGWVLNLFKHNDEILSTSLYDPFGKMVENKVFMLQKSTDIDNLKEYVDLFEDDPDKNIRSMSKIKAK